MVKKFIIFLCISTFAFATLVEDKVESFIGEKAYKTQKNLIRVLFQNDSKYFRNDGTIDDVKVLTKLKESGLLKLFYSKPIQLNLTFSTKRNGLIFMRVINESLESMGYNYFLTKRAVKKEDSFIWSIVVSTEHMVDPLILSKRLNARGCFLESVERKTENEWVYEINSENIKIDSLKIEPNDKVRLKKPIKPYWIDMENIKSISFGSAIADRWHPKIVFYDDKLYIIKDYNSDRATNRLKLKVPQDAKYVKVTDIYSLNNIKRGLSIYLIGR